MIDIIILMRWDEDIAKCEARTYADHFLNGSMAAASTPTDCLDALVDAWESRDTHQAMLDEIDSSG